jgi:hypothetical protein
MKLFTEYETVTQNLPDIDAAINVLPNITLWVTLSYSISSFILLLTVW